MPPLVLAEVLEKVVRVIVLDVVTGVILKVLGVNTDRLLLIPSFLIVEEWWKGGETEFVDIKLFTLDLGKNVNFISGSDIHSSQSWC